jgi:RNase adaptor protein for sRNA GlmZ degradation
LEHVYGIVDYSVEKYRSRGFTHLMVSFGCTGGQHRSVYSAEHLAAHLGKKYGVRIVLEHREQGIVKIENGKI